jgi:hypothetical protein
MFMIAGTETTATLLRCVSIDVLFYIANKNL